MNIRTLAAIFAGLLLTSCSAGDLNDLISYPGLSDKPDKAAPPATDAASPATTNVDTTASPTPGASQRPFVSLPEPPNNTASAAPAPAPPVAIQTTAAPQPRPTTVVADTEFSGTSGTNPKKTSRSCRSHCQRAVDTECSSSALHSR